jgi:hypothetical protein
MGTQLTGSISYTLVTKVYRKLKKYVENISSKSMGFGGK